MHTTNPYSGLGASSFWKTAVSSVPVDQIRGLTSAGTLLARHEAIGTAGSCFAQHIGRRLTAAGYRLIDVEPAPPFLKPERRSAYGFGLFSGRYGNVYTTAQLKQLILRAYGHLTPEDHAWEEAGCWFDPFRPTIEPGGFASEAELLTNTTVHLQRVRGLFSQLDVFVFTLGLTEAWRSRIDGSVYPMCPGTTAGRFDATRHEFVNYTSTEVAADLNWCIGFLRRINPSMRFILTVSPVPLTATASGRHVLTATTYSKSVLRTVAGEAAGQHGFVDYFPSYEIINSPVFRGAFFEPNLRSVTTAGVDFVMSTFFREFCVDPRVDTPDSDPEPPADLSRTYDESGADEDEAAKCDEAVLEFYA